MEKFEILDTKGNIISVECPVGVAERVENDSDMIEEIVNYASSGNMTELVEEDAETKDGIHDANIQMEIHEDDDHDLITSVVLERANWTPAPTRLLIKLMHQNIRKLGRVPQLKTKKQLWEFIGRKLKEEGYDFSYLCIENKWKGLERQYKKCNSGYSHLIFPYKKEMEEIQKIRDNYIREIIEGNSSAAAKNNASIEEEFEDEETLESSRKSSDDLGGCIKVERTFWTHQPTVLLINCMKKYLKRLGRSGAIKTKRQMWHIISEDLKANGYIFTPESIENKWKGLDRQYKKVLEYRKKGQLRRATFIYEEDFNEMYKHEKMIPECLLSSAGDETYGGHMEETQFESLISSPKAAVESSQKKDIQLATRRLAAYEKRTAAIERRNNLIEKLLEKLC